MLTTKLFLLTLLASAYVRADWTLTPNDPTACPNSLYPPINFNTSAAVFYPGLTPMKFINYDANLYYNFTNNGFTILAYQTRDLSVRPFIVGSDFGSDIFVFQQLHFHWGPDYTSGSEHLFDNQAFPLELHLVHQSLSGTIGVVAFVFQLSAADNPNLYDLIKTVGFDLNNGSTVENITLSKIFPNIDMFNKDGYYRYIGSFEIYPCLDGVLWNVYKDPIPISINQLAYFYKNQIRFNTRQVSQLGQRTLFFSVPKTS